MFTEKDEHRTSNAQHRPSEIEIKFHGVKMMNKKPELLNDILEETEELIKIFVTIIKTAEKKKK